MKARRAIVITGTPGTGKSTIGEAVADKAGIRCLSLNLIAAEQGALDTKDPARDSVVVDAAALRKALNRIFADAKDDVVIEGHFGDLVPERKVKIAIVLRTNPLVLKERLKARGYTTAKINENAEAELLDSCLIAAVDAFGEDAVREVDTTTMTVQRATEEVLKAVNGKGGCPAGSVNWVKQLEGEGRLRELIH